MSPRILLPLLFVLTTACAHAPEGDQGDGHLYSYVDAQGNLVTIEREPPPPDDNEGGEERYQSTEEVDAMLERRQRDRFVTFIGPDGQVVTRPVDLVAERETKATRPEPFTRLKEKQAYLETVTRVPVDCCAHLINAAKRLGAGEQLRASFRPGEHGWIRLEDSRPAVVMALEPGLGGIRVASYVHSERYLAPELLLLDAEGRPILRINNLFTRRYPENWHRYGYFEGRLPVQPRQRYLVLYLPYAHAAEAGIVLDGETEGALEEGARPALTGELVVFGERPGT